MISLLLQLISCLQCRKCPHYFLPNVDLFKGKSIQSLDNAAKQFSEAFDAGLHPADFVNKMRKEGQLIMGIGHRVKSV